MRFETAPGEQAQVDWGSLSYIGADGKQRRVWVFVMTMGWSRACYVELVRKADTAAFIQCHVNAFEYLGGVPRRCLYDNAKVITLGRDVKGGAKTYHWGVSTSSEKQPSCVSRGRDGGIPGPPSFRHAVEHG